MSRKPPKIILCRNLKKKSEHLDHEYLLGIKAYLMIHRNNPGIRLNGYYVFRKDIQTIVKNSTCMTFAKSYENKTMEEVSSELGVNLAFWYRPDACSRQINEFVLPELMCSVSDPDNNLGTVNFLLDRKNVDVEKAEFSLDNCSLILDESICGPADNMCNIFEAVALEKNITAGEIISQWSKSTIQFNEEKIFARKFGTGFEIWSKKIRTNIDKNDVKKIRLTVVNRCVLKSSSKNPIYLHLYGKWSKEKFTLDENDKFKVSDGEAFKHFDCPNNYCSYRTSSRQEYDRHMSKCKSETNHIYHQQNLTDTGALEYLLKNKFLSKKPQNFQCAFYDIETTALTKDEAISGETIIKSTAKLATISVTKNFGDKTTKVFSREDSSERSYLKLINEFIRYV